MEVELVSVVVPTWNGADKLPALLAGLDAQEGPFALELVAVDSGSSDGTTELLAEFQRSARPGLEVVIDSIAPGEFDHGDTRNRAIGRAHGELVALLTQDAVPHDPKLLSELMRPFRDPRVAGAYGRQIPRPDCDVVTRRQLEGWLTGRAEPALSSLDGVSLTELTPSDRHARCVFDNVCSMLRRSVWRKHPFPRVDFAEDLAWGRAVLEAGYAIAYTPAAAVVHSHRRSLTYEFERTRACHRELRRLFGLTTLPRRRDVLRAILANWRQDLPYVLREAPKGAERWRQLARIAGLSVVSPLAQYLGARSAGQAEPDRQG